MQYEIPETGYKVLLYVDSVGCTSIDYSKEPLLPGSIMDLTYSTEDMGHFHRTMSVYGNIDNSLLIITLKGIQTKISEKEAVFTKLLTFKIQNMKKKVLSGLPYDSYRLSST